MNLRDNANEKISSYEGASLTVQLNLSNKITIQKRVVYTVFEMLGDVGGLYDFFALGLTTIFGVFSDRLMLSSLIPKIFRYTIGSENSL